MSFAVSKKVEHVDFFATRTLWNNAWHHQDGKSLESICAKITCIVFPIIFAVAIIESMVFIGRKIGNLCGGNKLPDPLPPDLLPDLPTTRRVAEARLGGAVHPKPMITVQLLPASSQYDIAASPADPQNKRPPACTFHSLIAASDIAHDFETWVARIDVQDVPVLSKMQRKEIGDGLRAYRWAVEEIDPAFREGANFEDIRNRWPAFFERRHLHFQAVMEETLPVSLRTPAIIEHLFADPQQKRIAWIKSGNEESFAVICHQDKAIVFDSHKNAISLIRGKREAQAFLTAKLLPHANIADGFDLSPFSYALGSFKD